MMKKSFTKLMLVLISVPLITITLALQESGEPWEVPSKFKSMENPNAADDESIKVGKMLYSKHCSSCHGKTGTGDGIKARTLDSFPGDFSGETFQDQTDGEHFYKSKFGRNEMPKFENKISDEDIWHMVNFMGTLKK